MTETPMIEAKGAEYVTAWPTSIALSTGRTESEVLAVLAKTYPGRTVGSLVTWEAKHIVNQVRALNPARCHYCGLVLPADNKCRECV